MIFLSLLYRIIGPEGVGNWSIIIAVSVFFKSDKNQGIEFIRTSFDDARTASINANKVLFVDATAEWCGPCKMIAPILDEVAQSFQGKLSVAKVNVDENRSVPAQFGIRGIPTLMVFKDGALAATKVGALSKAQLEEFVNSQLA